MKSEDILQQIHALDQRIEQQPHDDQLFLERGNLYWKLQDWKHTLEDYEVAIRLNPSSPAVELRQMAQQVIAFYHKDRYNP